MKHYLIYKITNRINNKIYIGKHITEDLNDGYMGSGKLIQLAIKKYGIKFFDKEIIFECSSEDEMNIKESEIVNDEFVSRLDTYNMHIGGKGGWDHINNDSKQHTEYAKKGGESRKRMISKMSDEEYEAYCSKISLSVRQYIEMNGSIWEGRKHSEETKRKMRKPHPTSNGKGNSQYGTMWICNNKTKESKKIKSTDKIPYGWRKGRICKK